MVWTILWRPLTNLNSVNRSKTLTPLLTFRNFNLNNTILGLQLRDKAAMLVEQTIQYATCTSPTMHLIFPPNILHSLCFPFLLCITAIPREIENNTYAKFWGAIRYTMGEVQVAYFFFRRICIKKSFVPNGGIRLRLCLHHNRIDLRKPHF